MGKRQPNVLLLSGGAYYIVLRVHFINHTTLFHQILSNEGDISADISNKDFLKKMFHRKGRGKVVGLGVYASHQRYRAPSSIPNAIIITC